MTDAELDEIERIVNLDRVYPLNAEKVEVPYGVVMGLVAEVRRLRAELVKERSGRDCLSCGGTWGRHKAGCYYD